MHFHQTPAYELARFRHELKLLLEEDLMALSARSQAIVDSITAITSTIHDTIANAEAAHDAANAAAEDADDTAIEAALHTLQNSLGIEQPAPVTLPAGDNSGADSQDASAGSDSVDGGAGSDQVDPPAPVQTETPVA